MQDKLHPIIKLLMLILINIILLVTKNIYLILFVTTFVLILALKSNISFKKFSKELLDFKWIYIIFLISYILVFKEFNFISLLLSIYKIFILYILFIAFKLNINIKELGSIIYTILLPLKNTKIDIEKITLDILMFFYLLNYFFKDNFDNNNEKNILKRITLKYLYCVDKVKKLEYSLKLSYYKVKSEYLNLKSKIVLVILILFFIIFLMKEVIL